MQSYANKIKDSLYWWLGRQQPFIINDEYKLELLWLDKENNTAKIRVTNLKTGDFVDGSSAVAGVSNDGK